MAPSTTKKSKAVTPLSAVPDPGPVLKKPADAKKTPREAAKTPRDLEAGGGGQWASPRPSAGAPIGRGAAMPTDHILTLARPSAGATPASPRPPPPAVFVYAAEDLAGLIISAWLVPTVKTPLKGLPAFLMAILLQGAFIVYMVDHLLNGAANACSTPAMLQICAIYVFGVAVFSNVTAVNMLQVVLHGKSYKADDDEARPVRATSRNAKCLLALVPIADLAIELAVLALGIVFLCTSESVEDVILNAVAINFISDIDEVLLAALIPKASKQRLLKYRFDGVRTSVEDGDTQMKTATETTKRVARFAGVAPLIWLVFSVGIVVGGQFWAKTLPSVVSGEVECRWLVPRHG